MCNTIFLGITNDGHNDLLQQENLLTCDHGKGVDVITDKGTLDAIGLSANPHGR
jgi:hypothetical protein